MTVELEKLEYAADRLEAYVSDELAQTVRLGIAEIERHRAESVVHQSLEEPPAPDHYTFAEALVWKSGWRACAEAMSSPAASTKA
jgi:hypothetical protein